MKRGNIAIENKIVEVISKGLGRTQACKAARLNYQTFLNWLNPSHANYNLEFLERIKKAEEEGLQNIKDTCVSVILKAATDNDKPVWQAAAWMLERRFSDEFSTKQDINHSGEIKTNIHPLTKEQADKLIEKL